MRQYYPKKTLLPAILICFVCATPSQATSSTSMTAFLLEAWVPQLGTPSVAPDSTESMLLDIGRKTQNREFASAETELYKLERMSDDPRTQIFIRLLRIGLEQRRYSYAGGTVLTSAVQHEKERMWQLIDVWVEEIASLAEKFPPSQIQDANAALLVALNLYDDLYERPSFVRNQVVLNLGEPLPHDFAELSESRMSKELKRGKFAELLSQTQQSILTCILDGRLAQAWGNWSEAERLFKEGLRIAEEAGLQSAEGFFLLSLGDLKAAPFGDVLTMGYDLSLEAVTLRLERNFDFYTRSYNPAQAVSEANDYYSRADKALKAADDTRRNPMMSIRKAYLKVLQNQYSSASKDYERAAESAKTVSPCLEATAIGSAAILKADPAMLARSIALFKKNGDIDAAAGIAQTGHSLGSRLWYWNRDLDSATHLLSMVELISEEEEMPFVRVSVVETLATIYYDTGRYEQAIQLLQEVVKKQEELIRRVQAHKESADTKESEHLWETTLKNEKRTLATLLLKQKMSVEALLSQNPVDLGDRLKSELETIETRLMELPGKVNPSWALRREFNLLVGRMSEGGAPTASIIERCNAMRPEIEKLGDPSFTAYVDVFMAGLDPKYLLQAKKSVEALQPVDGFASALPAEGQPFTLQTWAKLGIADMNANRALGFALEIDAFDLAGQWLDAFASMSKAHPQMRMYQSWMDYWRAVLAAETDPPEKAVKVLTETLERPAIQWSPENIEHKIDLMSRLVEVQAALIAQSGNTTGTNAESVLVSLLRMRLERDKSQAVKSGVNPVSGDGVELAMLSRKASVEAGLSREEKERYTFLRKNVESQPTAWEMPTLLQIQSALKSLPADTVLLAYYLGLKEIVIWRGEADKPLRMMRLEAPVKELVNDIIELRARLASSEEDVQELSRRVYERLIQPVGDIADNATLVIMAPGALVRVPFEVLGPSPEEMLLFEHPVVYVEYLARPLPARKKSGHGKEAVVIAPLVGRLEQLEAQADEVAQILHTKPLTQKQDSEKHILEALERAWWIHIASHTVINPSNPYLSYLELPDYNRLELWEMFKRAASADVVVLSSCSTQSSGGAASVNFATPILTGGARWVVSTRWGIYDDKARRLMVDFYEGMFRNRKTIIKALQEAKIYLARSGKTHPHYWAPFVLTSYDLSALQDDTPR